MTGLQIKTLLVTAASALALAACGSAEVASPGEGDFGNGGGTPPTNPGNPGAPGTPAASCPTGLIDVGLVGGATLRACQLPATIEGNLTLADVAGTVYVIAGGTQVGRDLGVSGNLPTGVRGQLNIEPGVVLMAAGNGDYLLINRGSQIFAQGTATNPIIFTSRQDIDGSTSDVSQQQWGGIVLAGRAPQANCDLTQAEPVCTGTVEGTNAGFGGNVPADNSGILRYVQVRYSGFVVGNNNELQALTLAGVGSGTTVEYFQSYNSSDDGIEIFGGNVNLKHIVINGADDDGLDTDTGWRGGAQFGIVTQRDIATSSSRSAGFEFSSAPTTVPLASRYVSQPKISNFTLVGRRAPSLDAHTVAHFDQGTDSTVINSVFTNGPGAASSCLDIADPDTATSTPVFTSVFMSCASPYRPANTARTQPIFTSGTGNTANGTSTLTAPAGATIANQLLTFINGANETGVTAVDARTVYNWFETTTYIGAVRNAQDTWWAGWTCGLQAGSSCQY
ncbi:hypothetical protein [Brevundimonas sp.]|jgi:hypothetical protein|uniref:hypothetical protein n=1 Tax=Brevundimonas sp. TaxID=1871086 RepID=UPI0037C03DB9